MADAGDTVLNPVSGERIVFVRTAADTAGELLEMEDFWASPDHRTQPHVHPEMEETWEVLVGRAGFEIGGEVRVAGPGEVVVAAAGSPHRAWNAADGETHLRITMRPALRWEEFVVRLFAAAQEGRVDEHGSLEPALAIELLREFSRELAPAPS